MASEASFPQLDDALLGLRRLWAVPASRFAGDGPGGRDVQFSTVLVADALRRLAGQRPPAEPTVAAVAGQLDVAESTASRLVERAVVAGVVERSASPDNRRRARLALTAAGERLNERARAFRFAYLRRLVEGWSDADVATLAGLLDRLAARVHAHPPPVPPQEVSP